MKLLAKPIFRQSNSVFKYIGAALLIFTPLYPKFPLFFLPSSTVAIRVEDFLIALGVLLLVFSFLKNRSLKLPPTTFQIVTLWSVGLLSTISAILITKNIIPLLSVLHFFRRVEYISLFFIFYYLGSLSQSNRTFFLKLILLPVVGVFLYGLFQIYFRAPVISTMNVEFSKGVALTLQPGVQLSSTFSGHYDLAIYLSFIVSFLMAILSLSKEKYVKGVMLLLSLPVIWLFAKAGSRMGLLGLISSVLVITVAKKKFFMGFIMLFLIGLGVLSSPHLIGRFQNIWKILPLSQETHRISLSTYAQEQKEEQDLRPIQQDRSTSIRFDVEWPRAVRSFYKNPLLGTGYSSLGLATDNDYLRALGETGLLGLVSFLSLLVALGRSLIKVFKKAVSQTDKILTTSALGVFVSMILVALFIDTFEASKIAILFWSISGLALSVNKK
jgi:O-antigen ligase